MPNELAGPVVTRGPLTGPWFAHQSRYSTPPQKRYGTVIVSWVAASMTFLSGTLSPCSDGYGPVGVSGRVVMGGGLGGSPGVSPVEAEGSSRGGGPESGAGGAWA